MPLSAKKEKSHTYYIRTLGFESHALPYVTSTFLHTATSESKSYVNVIERAAIYMNLSIDDILAYVLVQFMLYMQLLCHSCTLVWHSSCMGRRPYAQSGTLHAICSEHAKVVARTGIPYVNISARCLLKHKPCHSTTSTWHGFCISYRYFKSSSIRGLDGGAFLVSVSDCRK